MSPVAPALLDDDAVNPVKIAMVIVLLVLSLGAHEAAHAWAALKCGDSTGRDLGRMTLNPIPHIDLWMTILLPTLLYYSTGGRFVFGGAKPVPVQFNRLRHPWRDMSLVALAGPLTNLVLALLFLAGREFFMQTGWYNGAAASYFLRGHELLPEVLYESARFNVILFVFNLVPIPPLDGSRVMAWLLPSNLRESYVALERWGMMIVLALLYLPTPLRSWISRTVYTVLHWMGTLVQSGGHA